MKTSISTFILVVVACAFAAGSPIQTNRAGANSADAARPIVNREANFGIHEWINLFVDGTRVAVLGYDESYDAPLALGNHVLSITTNPQAFP